MAMVNVLKFRTNLFRSQIKCWLSRLEFTNCLSKWQTGKTLIRLLLQKQSDLGLHCLSMPFMQATSVRNCRTFTECLMVNFIELLDFVICIRVCYNQ